MKHLRYVLYFILLSILWIKQDAAAAWLQDAAGHPEHWQVVALATWSVVSVGIACALVCAAVLAWNYLRYELPANRRKKAQP